jgi:DNA-directed RNA polymerase specialized sigma24 family protein
VPAGNRVSSLTGISAGAKNGAVAFTTTQWSVVLDAQSESPSAQEALEKLCRTYWWPLYGFVRRQGYFPEEAQDLTQGFFAMLLERKDFDAVQQEKGRLRSYLLASLKNFLAKAHRRAATIKRGEGRPLVPLEDLIVRERADLEPADTLSADRIYERRWANAQRIVITLFNFSDGTNTNDVSVPIGYCSGILTGNGAVTSKDVTLAQSKVGQTVNGTEFREDVTLDGLINSTDANLVRSKVGTKTP